MKSKLFLLLCFISSYIFSQFKKGELIVEVKNTYIKDFKVTSKKKSIRNYRKANIYSYHPISYSANNKFFLVKFNHNIISTQKAFEELKKMNVFEHVELNYKGSSRAIERFYDAPKFIPNDEHYKKQWALKNDGTFNPFIDRYSYEGLKAKPGADIKMEQAWGVQRKGDPNLIVAIIDSGVYYDHPEFEGRVWKNKNEIPNNGIDDDDNGYIDDVNGWDFAYDDNDPSDDYSHGTNVASIALASNDNNEGFAGINGQSKMMVIKVLDSRGTYYQNDLASALRYAVDNGAKVINLSLGSKANSYAVKKAINYCYRKGAVVVVATANGGIEEEDYPAAYSNTIAVGGTNVDDTRIVWNDGYGSSYGDYLDIVAPGNIIYGLSHSSDYDYSKFSGGTSQAAPHVTGVISLMLSMNPNLTFPQIRSILRNTADDQVGRYDEDTYGFDIYHGYGRLNAYKALLATRKILNNNRTLLYKNDKAVNSLVLKPENESVLSRRVTCKYIKKGVSYPEQVKRSADLLVSAIYTDPIHNVYLGENKTVHIRISNYGYRNCIEPSRFTISLNGIEIGSNIGIPALAKGESKSYSFDITNVLQVGNNDLCIKIKQIKNEVVCVNNNTCINNIIALNSGITSNSLLTDNASILNSKIKFFPNPTLNVLKINTVKDVEIKQINIRNMNNVIVKKLANFTSNYIDVSNLNTGVYMLEVLTKDGSLITQKIVKK